MPEKLTEKVVKSVHPPASGATTVWDSEIKGFGLRAYAAGSKSFFLNYRLDGRERRYTIGNYPGWSVEAARTRAKELRKQIDKGHDPASVKRERREAPTIQDLVDRYVEDHLPKKSQDELRKKDELKMLDEIVQHVGKHTKVADVHGGDIAAMHRKISESIGRRGPRRVRANRVLSVCSKMFSLSLVPKAGENKPWRDAALGNPCKGIAKNHEEERERFFSQAELAGISDALNEYPGVAADCMRLIMLTGCRPGEALKAKWEEFDREPGSWIKPSAHTKQRKVHRLPLSPPAIELIDRLRTKKRKGRWVFPGDVQDEPLKTLWHVWAFVKDRAQLKKDENGNEARIYDLRHSFATVGVAGGLSLPLIGKLLGHSQPRTTARYAHAHDDPLREAATKITNVIVSAGRPATVVPIRGGR